MTAPAGSVVSSLHGPMMNRRTVPFGAVFLASSFGAGAALPRHAPYPVFLTSAVVVGALVGFVGMVAFMRNRVGSMELETKTKLLTLRTPGIEQRFSLGRELEFAEFGIPEA